MSGFDHLNDFPKLHPRRKGFERKRIELQQFLLNWRTGLTASEEMLILSYQLSALAQDCVAAEREDGV